MGIADGHVPFFGQRRAALGILLLYLPGLTALALGNEGTRAELVTLACYLSYLILALNRSHREYEAMLALELQLLEQRQRLDTLSRTDVLTQLGNRYQFNNLFPAMCASAQRHGSELSLLHIWPIFQLRWPWPCSRKTS